MFAIIIILWSQFVIRRLSSHNGSSPKGSRSRRSYWTILTTAPTSLPKIMETFHERNPVTSWTSASKKSSKLEQPEIGVLELWRGLVGSGSRGNRIPLIKVFKFCGRKVDAVGRSIEHDVLSMEPWEVRKKVPISRPKRFVPFLG
jgi:hypothetical protein